MEHQIIESGLCNDSEFAEKLIDEKVSALVKKGSKRDEIYVKNAMD